MSLSKKYNIPEETVKDMVKHGVISCSISRQFEIYDYYQQFMSSGRGSGKSKSVIYYEISQDLKVSDSYVKQIVYKLDTKL